MPPSIIASIIIRMCSARIVKAITSGCDFSANLAFPRRPALRAASMLTRSSEDARLDQLGREGSEVGSRERAGGNSPDRALVAGRMFATSHSGCQAV